MCRNRGGADFQLQRLSGGRGETPSTGFPKTGVGPMGQLRGSPGPAPTSGNMQGCEIIQLTVKREITSRLYHIQADSERGHGDISYPLGTPMSCVKRDVSRTE